MKVFNETRKKEKEREKKKVNYNLIITLNRFRNIEISLKPNKPKSK